MSNATLLLVIAACFLLFVVLSAIDWRRHRRNGGER